MGQKYNQRSKADKVIELVGMPTNVIVDATTAQPVKRGSICRIKGADSGLVAFGKEDMPVPTSTDKEALETPADFILVTATDDFIRTSVAMRIEVIAD